MVDLSSEKGTVCVLRSAGFVVSPKLKRIDVRFQFGPAREPVFTSDLELCIGKRASIARLQ
jgi:hypothetical protein